MTLCRDNLSGAYGVEVSMEALCFAVDAESIEVGFTFGLPSATEGTCMFSDISDYGKTIQVPSPFPSFLRGISGMLPADK